MESNSNPTNKIERSHLELNRAGVANMIDLHIYQPTLNIISPYIGMNTIVRINKNKN